MTVFSRSHWQETYEAPATADDLSQGTVISETLTTGKSSASQVVKWEPVPRKASLRQGHVLVSPPYSHFRGGVKWKLSCHINKQRCHSCLQFQPPKGEFLSHAGKQQTRGSISHTKNSRITQPLTGEQGQAISLWAKQFSFSWLWLFRIAQNSLIMD